MKCFNFLYVWKMVSMNGISAIINKIIDLHFARSNPWQNSVKKSPRVATDLPKNCQQFATSLCILPRVIRPWHFSFSEFCRIFCRMQRFPTLIWIKFSHLQFVRGYCDFAWGLLLAFCPVWNCNLPGVSLALLLANLPGAEAPGIVPWQNARFLVVNFVIFYEELYIYFHCFDYKDTMNVIESFHLSFYAGRGKNSSQFQLGDVEKWLMYTLKVINW